MNASTVLLVDHLPSGHAGKITLVTDCMSPVVGLEAQHHAFLADVAARGVTLASSLGLQAQLASVKMAA